MTLLELRNLFADDTRFLLCVEDNLGVSQYLPITNILWGTSAFATMEVSRKITASGDTVTIPSDMPYEVFMAWKEYAESNR